MSIKEHPCCQRPENPNAKIWRYMDFSKLLWMLDYEEGSLHFARADKFDDRFEGLPPKANQQQTEREWTQAENDLTDESCNGAEIIRLSREIAQSIHRTVGVSSWYCNEHESAAMWNLYGASYGIAVQSNVHRLLDTLKETTKPIMVGLVKYGEVEYDNLDKCNSNIDCFHWILWKRSSFAHENELRAVISEGFQHATELPETGVTIRIPVASLIEKVVVAPDAPFWFSNLVKSVCRRYLPQIKVDTSCLDERPLW